jgi:hypothetical protein
MLLSQACLKMVSLSVKDAVYETILLKERENLHRNVAVAIEVLFSVPRP